MLDDEIKLRTYTSGLASTTAKVHGYMFLVWHSWCLNHNVNPCNATFFEANAFFQHYRKRPGMRVDGLETELSLQTVKRGISALRGFYSFLIRNDLYSGANPWEKIIKNLPKGQDAQRRPNLIVPFEKIMDVIKAPENQSPRGIRDRAMMALLFGGGLRLSESLYIRLVDLKISGGGTFYVRIGRTKAGVSVHQTISPSCEPIIVECARRRKLEGAGDSDLLITNYRGDEPTNTACDPARARRRFKRYAEKAGVRGATPHWARVTAISYLASMGIPYREIREFSRHADIRMVERYDRRRFEIDDSPAKKLVYK